MSKSQFGIRAHAQVQSIDGESFEFQPEHLLCDECWSCADTAYAHALWHGVTTAFTKGFEHSMTVTRA